MKRRTVTWTYTVCDESDDDDETVEFTDASQPSFLLEQDDDDLDADLPDQPDPIIGFRKATPP